MRLRRYPLRDDGAILPIVLVISLVLSGVVVSLATYITTDLRYGNVVEERADRLAAADGGLRFGVEKLRNFQSLCTTKAGTGGGLTTVFPPLINGAVTTVTCRRVGNSISDVQGWGVVITGQGLAPGASSFLTKGGVGGDVKTFSGPVYIANPAGLDLAAPLEIKDGDLWYSAADCDVPVSIPEIGSGDLVFAPDVFRGPICTELTWDDGLFSPPTASTPPTNVAALPTDVGACKVFYPGKYTLASKPVLGSDNYFMAGDYYFENVGEIEIKNQTWIAGFPTASAGDAAKISAPACATVQATDKAVTLSAGGLAGATFYLGGDSRFKVDTGGEFEVFRRLKTESYVSIYVLQSSGAGYMASTLKLLNWVVETRSGSTNDVAIHGLIWAPNTRVSLGNISNSANGQLLGGVVVAVLDTQASASASAFAIGIETNPVSTKLLLESTATLNGKSISIRAVVQYRPDSGELAINSWRVAG